MNSIELFWRIVAALLWFAGGVAALIGLPQATPPVWIAAGLLGWVAIECKLTADVVAVKVR
jgi:hypothetical protein